MNTKALAKSKRAHSLHHSKKHHPHQASKAPPISPGDKKPTVRQSEEKALHSHGSRPLPSNWDRYDADLDLSSEDSAPASSSQLSEIVGPKSKGADYGHLISEAKAQSQLKYSSDMLPSFNDVIADFTQDFGPMLAAKGQSMISWIADDNFEFEGKANTNFEAQFLSLNLNALAEQLAKAKLSERLFLEPDLLPPELLDDGLPARSEDKHDPQPCTSAVAMDSGVQSPLGHNQEGDNNVQEYHESSSSSIAITRNFPVQTSEEGLKPRKQIKDEILQSEQTDRSISPKPLSKHVPESVFEAASAEAELDMLLNSFAETKILDSSSASSIETVRKGTHLIKIDDNVDNLLEETSDGIQISHGINASADTDDVSSSKVHPSSNSKLLDDFDSWLDTI